MYRNHKGQGRVVTRRTTAGLALLAILLVPLIPFFTPANAATSRIDSSQFQLEITPLAPKLPADGGTYYAIIQLQTANNDKPIASPYDLDIVIISSDPSVLTGQNVVSLKEGESMVKAELITTKKAGEVSISAQTEGIESDSITINTLALDSQEPSKLVVYSAPSTFVPDPNFEGMLYVQLLNSQNIPTVTKNSVTVTLSSSKPEIGTVPSYVIIAGGQSGAIIDFTPKYEIGSTKISASATGLAPAQLDVKTNGPKGSTLAVEFGPPRIPAAGGYNSFMTVQLRDDTNLPVKASQPVLVTLRSSDTDVAKVPSTAEIKTGQSYVRVIVESKGGLGSTVITASATGLGSGINTLNSVELSPDASDEDRRVNIYAVPSLLPPDNSEHAAIILQLTDSAGRPWITGSSTYEKILLSSSDSKIGSVLGSIITHNTYAEAKFKTTYVAGETIITGSSTGYAPAQLVLKVTGSAPAALMLTQIPAIVDAKNVERDYLAVSLLDSAGKPVIAPEDITVYLSSSESAIASVQASATISAGQGYGMIRTKTTDKAGESTVTATAADLASANIQFKTIGYAGSISQYALGLFTVPRISADGQEHEVIFIQLQDQTDSPVPAKSDVAVSLSSSSAIAGNVQREAIIPAGKTFATAKFITTNYEVNDLTITASSPGFISVETKMDTTLQPLNIRITNPLPKQASFGDEELLVEVEVKAGIFPAKGATVEIGGPQADPTTVTTDENGRAAGTYVSVKPGLNTVEAKATMAGFSQAIAKTSVSFSQTIDLVVKAVSEGGRDIGAQFKIGLLNAASKSYSSKDGTPIKINNAKWGTYRITAPEEFTSSSGKFTFVSWSDGRTENPRSFDVFTDMEVRAVYSAQFLVQATSEYGRTTGTGYYNEGDIANISVDATSVSSGIIDKTFAGWSGDLRSEAQGAQVEVDGPKVIKAVWQDSYLKIGLIAGAIAAGGVIAWMKVIKPRKEEAAKTRAPDLDWYKA